MTKAEELFAAQNKLKAYDQESQRLMLYAMKFDDADSKHFSLPEIVYLLRNSFKESITRYQVLGKYEYQLYSREFDYDSNGVQTKKDPAKGFCMVSSYLIYSMTGGDKIWELYGTPEHWWLYHKQTHMRFDITHTQFDKETLNAHYLNGKNVKYLNTDSMFWDGLQMRAKILAERAGLK